MRGRHHLFRPAAAVCAQVCAVCVCVCGSSRNCLMIVWWWWCRDERQVDCSGPSAGVNINYLSYLPPANIKICKSTSFIYNFLFWTNFFVCWMFQSKEPAAKWPRRPRQSRLQVSSCWIFRGYLIEAVFIPVADFYWEVGELEGELGLLR